MVEDADGRFQVMLDPEGMNFASSSDCDSALLGLVALLGPTSGDRYRAIGTQVFA